MLCKSVLKFFPADDPTNPLTQRVLSPTQSFGCVQNRRSKGSLAPPAADICPSYQLRATICRAHQLIFTFRRALTYTIKMDNSSGQGKAATLPEGVAGWSWGAFLLNWIWAPFNRTWIGLLGIVPYLGFIIAFILGFKGREWAWRNKHWDSVEHFLRVQRRWTVWGLVISAIEVGAIVIYYASFTASILRQLNWP